MRLENKKVFLSILLTCSLLVTTGFGTFAGYAQSETQEIETVSQEVEISPLAETIEQIPVVAEDVVKKAEEKAQRKAEKKAQKLAEKEAARETQTREIKTKRNKPLAATVSETKLLAALIYCEAGNQPYKGQVAVGAVVMNRIRSSKYPNSMREVIYQRGQFGPAITGWLDRVLAEDNIPERCYKAAKAALNGENPIGDFLYFGCGNYGVKIGDHWFH